MTTSTTKRTLFELLMALGFLQCASALDGILISSTKVTVYRLGLSTYQVVRLNFLNDVQGSGGSFVDKYRVNLVTVPDDTLSASVMMNGCVFPLAVAVEPSSFALTANNFLYLTMSSSYVKVDSKVNNINLNFGTPNTQSQSVAFPQSPGGKAVAVLCVSKGFSDYLSKASFEYSMAVVRNVPDQVVDFSASSNFTLQNKAFNNKYVLPPLSSTKVLYNNVAALSVKAVSAERFSAELQYAAPSGSNATGTVSKDVANLNQTIPAGVDSFAVLLKNPQNYSVNCELQLQTGQPSPAGSSLAWYVIAFAIVLPAVAVLLLLVCLCLCCCNRQKRSAGQHGRPQQGRPEDLGLYPSSEQLGASSGHPDSDELYKPDANNPYYVPPVTDAGLDVTNEDIKLHGSNGKDF